MFLTNDETINNTLLSKLDIGSSMTHQKETQKQCQEEVWHLIASELGDTIKMHLKQCDGWKQAIKNCENQREEIYEVTRQFITLLLIGVIKESLDI